MDESLGEPSPELLRDAGHSVTLKADLTNGDVYLECSSRLALREFAKSLLAEANTGTGWAEYYALEFDGTWHVVNGARFTEGSSRLFVSYSGD